MTSPARSSSPQLEGTTVEKPQRWQACTNWTAVAGLAAATASGPRIRTDWRFDTNRRRVLSRKRAKSTSLHRKTSDYRAVRPVQHTRLIEESQDGPRHCNPNCRPGDGGGS